MNRQLFRKTLSFSGAVAIFFSFFVIAVQAEGSQINREIAILRKLVKQTAANLALDPENDKAGNRQFLINAQQKLVFLQTALKQTDFLDEDYLNLGLLLLAVEFRRPQAAVMVVKKQLVLEKDALVIKWLESRMRFFKSLEDCNRHHPKWQNVTIDSELKFFQELFE